MKAREELIAGNLRLVLSVIQRFANRGENADDLFQVGCIGLIKAIDNFNTDLDVRFSTYEMCIRDREMGVRLCYVTLHVGLGTFRPVKEEEITDHEMHSEYCMVPGETARIINETRKNGGRVICVGTTSCRTVESFAAEDGTMEESAGWTNIFIYPGYRFKVLDGLITNFHLPESTLIMLVSALAGREHVLAAYREAVRERYRFFSFGDAMLIADFKEQEREKG